eukprot:CAMPEP_0198733604 /NCGR_PEP_ID=MMETSP1475-20131203/46946_1 /TAXON_ID= ORGANISM="Unidentified sp., Strain CCMP1999" /NCGR_SAMPLE_ID=MMETSP1475 /ASSEMBLY_ACC=CAM_ASM_001111 /LENGTH=150 /DNA_ID=CAMNT_0044496931 /DNA_START=57 /DNA_END=509 /DNA_ORIENTATION=-
MTAKRISVTYLCNSDSADESISDATAIQRGSRPRWTAEEDEMLRYIVKRYGEGNWALLARQFPFDRTCRQIRARWKNHLDPKLSHRPWTVEEDQLLIDSFREHGSSWSKIAVHFKDRCDNQLKNRYYLLLRSASAQHRDPAQHLPRSSRT